MKVMHIVLDLEKAAMVYNQDVVYTLTQLISKLKEVPDGMSADFEPMRLRDINGNVVGAARVSDLNAEVEL